MSVEKIAVIGMACRFPGAENVAQFWRNLRDGVESVRFFGRSELLAAGLPTDLIDQPNYVPANGVLDDIDQFDANFFGLSPREAEITDPQHRVFLECAWSALEDAGHIDGEGVSVYAGAGLSSYLLNNLSPQREKLPVSDFQLLVGNNKDFVPTRVSYKLDLQGASVNVNTACSTSLVAVHLACQGLIDFECDVALAGGVGIQTPQTRGYLYESGGIVSADGHCRPFDVSAQGTINGSGAGVVVLKRLEDALEDGDTVHAVILGTAINNDGADKVGFTAPSVNGQAQVIAEAMARAEVSADSISYIEAHGTATALGDPIEIAALTQVFREQTQRVGYCGIGSVKSNFGHLDEAAGVAGLIKTILALREGELPPSLHFSAPNPRLKLETSPFYVNADLQTWRRNGQPRRAGVSSFGIGGTNAHVVLEEPPTPLAQNDRREAQIILLSAKTSGALAEATDNLSVHLQKTPHTLADIAQTLAQGRHHFARRRAVVAQTHTEAIAALRRQADAVAIANPQVVFMFSGQGSQYAGMAEALYAAEPVFRETLNRCFGLLGVRGISAELLTQTRHAQPILFAIEYALAQMWQAWGVQPAALIGHSLGEYVAACLAGVFSLEDALWLVTERGRVMQACEAGGMAAVRCDEQTLVPYLNSQVVLAAVNSADQCVISGADPALNAVLATLEQNEIHCHRLATKHAFHSPLMESALPLFRQKVAQIARRAPQIPIVSNVTGEWLSADQATNPDYWTHHLRQTVRFADGLQQLADYTHFLEVGVGTTLAKLAVKHDDSKHVYASLPPERNVGTDVAFARQTLGDLWATGVAVDWTVYYAEQARRRVPLPTYPFQRQRYWIDAPKGTQRVKEDIPTETTTVERADVTDWFYRLDWKRSPLPNVPPIERCQFALAGESRILVEKLPTALWEQLATLERKPEHIVYCAESAENTFYDLLALIQTLDQKGWADNIALTAITQGDSPYNALVSGILRVIPLEYPTIYCRHIAVGDLRDSIFSKYGISELVAGQEPSVRYCDGERFVPTLVPNPLPDATPTLRDDGVYVVTGGAGSMGSAFADHLAQNGAGTVVRIGRSPHPELPNYIQADLSDHAQMTAALADIRARFGTIRGVVHTAGVLGQGLMRHKTRAMVEAVFAPKVQGSLVLTDLLRDDPLDFLLLCGSMAAIAPIAGQVDYCAANAFMAALAAQLRNDGVPATCLDWGFWQELGMVESAEMPAAQKAAIMEEVRAKGQGQAGVDAFARVLSAESPARLIITPESVRNPVNHPLFSHSQMSGDDVVYTLLLKSAEHWVVDEHRLDGVATLPGTAYLELARAAFADHTGATQLRLRDVYFLAPLTIVDGTTVEVCVVLQTNGDFHIVSRGGNDAWLEHARGSISEIEVAALQTSDRSAAFQEAEPLDFAIPFGDRWQCVERVAFREDGTGMARLALGDRFSADLQHFTLHPALFDMATGFAALQSDLSASLPFSYGEVEIYLPLNLVISS